MEAEAHAKHCRLVSLYNRANPSFMARATLVVGNSLVKVGTRLQEIGRRHLAPTEELYHERLQ